MWITVIWTKNFGRTYILVLRFWFHLEAHWKMLWHFNSTVPFASLWLMKIWNVSSLFWHLSSLQVLMFGLCLYNIPPLFLCTVKDGQTLLIAWWQIKDKREYLHLEEFYWFCRYFPMLLRTYSILWHCSVQLSISIWFHQEKAFHLWSIYIQQLVIIYFIV